MSLVCCDVCGSIAQVIPTIVWWHVAHEVVAALQLGHVDAPLNGSLRGGVCDMAAVGRFHSESMDLVTCTWTTS